jgi:hypothetical protein
VTTAIALAKIAIAVIMDKVKIIASLLSVFVKIVGKFFDDVGPLPTDVEAKT